MYIKAITVQGDSNKAYVLTTDLNGRVECQCPAYYFSSDKSCKHIRFVAKAMTSA